MKEEFDRLAEQWHSETGHHSSITIRKRHPAYQAIVDMGWPVVPYLLEKLQMLPDYWFPILRDITGENPVAFDDRGYYDKMVQAWLTWDKRRANMLTAEDIRKAQLHKLWDQLYIEISALLDKVEKYLVPNELQEIKEFLNANEFGIALDTLKFILEHIGTEFKEDVVRIENMMKEPNATNDFLDSLKGEKLAAIDSEDAYRNWQQGYSKLKSQIDQAVERLKPNLTMPYDELSIVTLAKAVSSDEGTLPIGSVGAIVHVFPYGKAYLVEFNEPFHTVATIEPEDLLITETECFTDFTPVQIASAREGVRDMLTELGGEQSLENIQKIAEMFQFSTREVAWLLNK